MTKLFTQFQLEVNNQLSYVFKDIPREKRRAGLGALAAALFKFVLGAWLYDEVYEFLIGRRPALDPIGIPVSYTHLDVYKRQDHLPRADSQCGDGRRVPRPLFPGI